jgi:rhomboid protease GluP
MSESGGAAPVPGPIARVSAAFQRLAGKAKSVPVLITADMFAYEEDRRVDFEKGIRHAPPLTMLLIVAIITAFAWQVYGTATMGPVAVFDEWALTRAGVVSGEWWRLISATFLHGGPDHIIGNLVSLYILGIACEQALGFTGVLAVYFVSALGGSIVSIALSPGPSVGASGAIFGLMGAVILVLHRHRNTLFVRDKRIGVVLAAWAGYTFLLGAISPMVDNGAHLGGFVAGALVGPLLPLRLRHVTQVAFKK